jgi:glucose 1-dehydrogenase
MERLKGQRAIVTGASSGIGEAVARMYAREGAMVGVNYRGKASEVEPIVEEIRKQGGQAVALKADVTDEKAVSRMFDEFVEAFTRVDILVANAGMQQDAPVTEMTAEQWRQVLDVNLTGQFLCAREAIKRFLAQGLSPSSPAIGKIICMSSVHEAIPWAGHSNYAASKGGVLLMMKTLAQELAPKKIRVNGIAPGAIKTDINKQEWSDPAKAKEMLKLIPYGRIGEPDDVAKAAVWLASDDSDYVTGETLFVDGGMSLYPGFRQGG